MESPSSELKRVARAHMVKARSKLEAAKRLFSDGFFEDAVSRAYYSMYHAAKACLILEDSSPRTHAGVISEFGRLFVVTGKVESSLGKALSAAKEDLEDSDYEVYSKINSKEVKKVLKEAEDFINVAEEISERS